MDVISVEEGMKRVVNNEKLYHRLLRSFSGKNLVDKIVESVQNENYEEAITACHGLKGIAANLAMHPLAAAAAEIENCLKAKDSPGDLLPKLLENLEAVEQAIEEILQ